MHGGDAIQTAVASSTYPLPGAEVRYWVGRGWRVLEQGYDLPDVYVCSIEVAATGDVTIPIRCPRHDLYGFYVLAGRVRLTGAGAPTAVLDTAAGHYRLSYLPAAAYTCHFGAGKHHIFYFVPKDTLLFREPSPELGAGIAPVEALRARLGTPKVSASLSMAGMAGDAIRRFLRHPGATYLRRYLAIQVLAMTLLLEACEALRVQEGAGKVGALLAQRMRTYIDERVADGGDVDTASVARRFAVSYVYAKMIFRKHIGQPIGGYIRGCKLEQARRMLEAGDSPTQAARYVCWTPAYFSRAFRAKYGYPPGQHGNAISS
ncbi:AraC-type DNA-binding protein [Parapedobacter luteus]|uniref:AraC-type DNA-binding protein n=1 Tax=Parapedobacter luteus TaxID=623280 RepID=A0A1T5CTP4_9SPHI|nr:AraC-type DNA-binding protein [Parapedobacter luteus]